MQAKNYVAVKQFYAIVPKKLTPQKSKIRFNILNYIARGKEHIKIP